MSPVLSYILSCLNPADLLDRENRLVSRRDGISRPGRTASVLLSGAGPEGTHLLVDFAAFQGVSFFLSLDTS